MTRVCLIGKETVDLQYELLSRETSRDALATYDLERPFENTIAVRTVSIGAAVSLCNDLQWYLVRFVADALVQEPSVSETEWLSRALATEIRNADLEHADTGEFLKIYGVETPDDGDDTTAAGDGASGASDAAAEGDAAGDPVPEGADASAEPVEDDSSETDDGVDANRPADRSPGRLVEPLYVRRTDGEVPEYDLRDVEDTLVVRLTEEEFSP